MSKMFIKLCSLLVMIAMLSIVMVDGDKRNVSISATLELAVKKTDYSICNNGYFDLSSRREMTFLRNKQVRHSWNKPVIGDGTELQCFDSSFCTSYPLTSATCVNKGFIGSNISWKCSAYIDRGGLQLSKMSVQCEAQRYPGDVCVLDGSCVLKYSFNTNSGMSVGGIIAICISVIVAIALLICCCVCCRRRDTGTVISTGSASTSRVFTSATPMPMPQPTQTFYSPPPNPPPVQNQFHYQAAAPQPMSGPSGDQPAFNPHFPGHAPYPDPPPAYSPSPYPPKQ